VIPRRLVVILSMLLVAVASLAERAAHADDPFSVTIDNPSGKIGAQTVIVATIAANDGFRVTESYRHRISNLAAADDGIEVVRKVVRGSVVDGRVIFRVEVVPKTMGPHRVVGVFRFSINNGQQLDIKAVPFEATVTAVQ
jgi:hypothetical protein